MSLFDGTKQPLSYAEALCMLVGKVGWPSDAHQAEVVKAIQVEHGVYTVPEAETRAAELERLRTMLAEKESAERQAAEEEELATLRQKLGIDHGVTTEAPVEAVQS